MELKFTPRTVKECEDRSRHTSILEMVSSISITELLIFVEKGLGVDKSQALRTVEEYLAVPDNDIVTLYQEVTKALQSAGFLPRSLEMDQLSNPQIPVEEDPSESTGETTNQPQ